MKNWLYRIFAKKSLSTKIILFSAPVVLIISVLFWCPSIMKFQSRELKEQQLFWEQQIELLKKSLYYSMLTAQREHIKEVIKSVSNTENILWLIITDKDNVVKFSSIEGDVGNIYKERFEEVSKDAKVFKKLKDKDTLLIYSPIENMKTCYTSSCHFHSEDEKILGSIVLAVDYIPIKRKLKEQGINVGLFGITFTTSLGLLFYILTRFLILNRLTKIADVSKKVASGDLSVTLPVTADTTDEIGQLEDSFNVMLEEIKKRSDKMQNELNSYRQSLFQAQKVEAIGQLATGIAHDFNNILTGIMGFAELTMLKTEDPGIKENLKRIIYTAERGVGLSRQILLIGKKLPPEKRPLDINSFVDESLKMLRRMIPENIEIRTFFKKDVPYVNADRSQLTQVLMNLIINARDAIEGNGVITISTDDVMIDTYYCHKHAGARPGHYVMLSVRDTGSGIPMEIRDKIFDPFFTTKGKGKGTGLGLSVSYSIIASHDGWINFYTELGKGTEFKVYLPTIEKTGITIQEPDVLLDDICSTDSSLTVLFVDDEEMIRDIGKSIFEKLGYKVLTASNGEEAIKIYKSNQEEISCIVMDLVMPVMDGVSAFREIKKINPDVKVIISSGYFADKMDVLLEDGVFGFLVKPYKINEVSKLMKMVTGIES